MTTDPAKLLIFAGVVLIAMGLFVLLIGKIPGLGRLPGDIHYESDGVGLHFPIVTCIIISVILTIVLRFLNK